MLKIMLLFNYKFDPATILAYVRIFASILKGMGYIPTVIQFFIELGVSLDRINVYLDTTELNDTWIERKSKYYERGEKYRFGIPLWNFS